MKRAFALTLIITLCLAFTGCGKVRNADKLISYAKRTHGACEEISRDESKDKTTVVLRDELQGFEYSVTSSMNDIWIDGASLGSLPNTSDSFGASLNSYVMENTRNEIEKTCAEYGAVADFEGGYGIVELVISPDVSYNDAAQAAEKTAEIIQEYNLGNRLDGIEITVAHDGEWLSRVYDELRQNGDTDSYIFSSAGAAEACHMGSVKLPDCSFRNPEKEAEDYYLEMAQMKYSGAVFIRKEIKTFADTGISLDRVQNSYNSLEPPVDDLTDHVMFYYFLADGKEFYICDFLDADTGTWYSNFKDMDITAKKK